MNFNQILSKTKQYIQQNYFLTGIILLTLVIRFYYFFLTKSQPIWWDEADYLNMAKSWAGMYEWKTSAIRPILFPLIFRFLLFFNLGETSMRILILLSSVFSVFFLYKIGELFFNKRTGLISAFLLAIFWSFTFYTNRLLVDVPVAFLWIITIYFFFAAYFKAKETKHFILPGILLGLAFLMKFSSVVLVPLIFFYLVFTEKTKLFKNIKIYVFYLTSLIVILPYLIWQKIKFGSFIAFYTATQGGDVEKAHTFFESFYNQALFSIKILDPSPILNTSIFLPLLGIFLFLGIALVLFRVFVVPELILKKATSQNKGTFIFLWLIFGWLFFGWLNYGEYMDERYYFIFYPAMFLFVAFALDRSALFLNKKSKTFSVIFLTLILFIAFASHIPYSSNIIKAKSSSFIELRQAGEFIRANTPEDAVIIIGEDYAELTYYTERRANTDGTLDNKTDLLNKINSLKAEYLVIPLYYYLSLHHSPGHVEVINFLFSDRKKFTPVATFGPTIDKKGQLPLVTVFRINH